MRKKIGEKLKKISKKVQKHMSTKEESEMLDTHFDPEGKVIFKEETVTPSWLITKLTCNFNSEKAKHCLKKCWHLPA